MKNMSKIKRLNRDKIISQFSEMREGFRCAVMVAQKNNDITSERCFKAYHSYADKIIVELGGESVLNAEFIVCNQK